MLIIDAACPVDCGDCVFVLGGPRYDYCCICSKEVDDFECGKRPDFCPIKGEILDYEIGGREVGCNGRNDKETHCKIK